MNKIRNLIQNSSKKIMIIIVVLLLLGSISLSILLITPDDQPTPTNNNNNIENSSTINEKINQENLNGEDVLSMHKTPKEYIAHNTLIINRTNTSYFRYSRTNRKQNKSLTYLEDINRGTHLIYKQDRNSRTYINIRELGVNYYTEMSQEQYFKLFGGIQQVYNLKFNSDLTFTEEDLKQIQMKYHDTIPVDENKKLHEFKSSNYRGNKFEKVRLNVLIDNNDVIRFMNLELSNEEQTLNMAVEYTDINQTELIKTQVWTQNAISEERAKEELKRAKITLGR